MTSFSYKHGLPPDLKGDGGGHVFDCRGLPNPFWVESLRMFTGRDQPVADFMSAHGDAVEDFLKPIRDLLTLTISSYEKDGKGRLSVAFGCTGGQHRSVYCAETIAAFLRTFDNCTVELVHCAQPFWKT